MTTVVVNDDVVELSTIAVVVAAEDTAEEVRELVEDAVVETNCVDEVDVSVFVEVAIELDVDVTSVDDAVVRAEDVGLDDVSEVSELSVLDEEVRDDVEDTVGVTRVVDATEDSVDARDMLVEGVCDSSVVDATVPIVDPEDESELATDVGDETVIVELSIWRTVVADAVELLEIRPKTATRMIAQSIICRRFMDTNRRLLANTRMLFLMYCVHLTMARS